MSKLTSTTQDNIEFVNYSFMTYCMNSSRIMPLYSNYKQITSGMIIKFQYLDTCELFLKWLETCYGITKEYKTKPCKYNIERYSVELLNQYIERMRFMKAIY